MENCWYEKGLSFSCTGCGKCCTGFPGYVWITNEEAQKIAQFLQIPLEKFLVHYVRKLSRGLSLKEISPSYACIFYQDKKCTIYPIRPLQCRSFPWWPEIVKNEENWKNASCSCEGINHKSASLVSAETIQKTLDEYIEKLL